MSATAPEQHDAASTAVASTLGELAHVMRGILKALQFGVTQVAVLDHAPAESVLENWPAPGARRALVERPSTGTDDLAVTTSGVTVLGHDEARIGGRIVNSGAEPVILYLHNAQRAGKGAIYLAANGGDWDLRLSNLLWCGTVFAVSQGGASTLTVAIV